MYFCSRCHFRHLQGRFGPFGFILKPVGPETLILSEWGVFFDVEKHRFRESMLVELSTVGFAPLGSYWSLLVRKRLFWTSSGCSYAHRGLSWSPAESSRVLRSLQESSGVLRSSQECCGVLRSPQESWGVFGSPHESCGVWRSPVKSCAICEVRRFIRKINTLHKIFIFPIKKIVFSWFFIEE